MCKVIKIMGKHVMLHLIIDGERPKHHEMVGSYVQTSFLLTNLKIRKTPPPANLLSPPTCYGRRIQSL